MKIMVEIPDAIFQVITARAKQQGQEFQAVFTDVLQNGLSASSPGCSVDNEAKPKMAVHPVTGLPFLDCSNLPPPEKELTPDRVAEILLQQEVEWAHEASRQ